jgi:hypothetical protein
LWKWEKIQTRKYVKSEYRYNSREVKEEWRNMCPWMTKLEWK